MKVPFFVKKIVREDSFSKYTARFAIHLIDGRIIYFDIDLGYLNSWPEGALESALWSHIFSALKQDAKEITIEDPHNTNTDWQNSGWIANDVSWKSHYSFPTLDKLSQAAAFGTPAQQNIGGTVGSTMKKLVPALSTILKCPGKDCSHGKMTLSNIIIILNDKHKWTREQIADWLDSLDLDLEFKEQNAEQS